MVAWALLPIQQVMKNNFIRVDTADGSLVVPQAGRAEGDYGHVQPSASLVLDAIHRELETISGVVSSDIRIIKERRFDFGRFLESFNCPSL